MVVIFDTSWLVLTVVALCFVVVHRRLFTVALVRVVIIVNRILLRVMVDILMVAVVVDWLISLLSMVRHLFLIVMMTDVAMVRLVVGLVRRFVVGPMMRFVTVSTFIFIACIHRLVMLLLRLSQMVFLRKLIRLGGNDIMISI